MIEAETLERLADMLAERVVNRLENHTRRKYVSRQEYAQAHGLGIRTVDRAIAENKLPITRQGRRVLISADAVIGSHN